MPGLEVCFAGEIEDDGRFPRVPYVRMAEDGSLAFHIISVNASGNLYAGAVAWNHLEGDTSLVLLQGTDYAKLTGFQVSQFAPRGEHNDVYKIIEGLEPGDKIVALGFIAQQGFDLRFTVQKLDVIERARPAAARVPRRVNMAAAAAVAFDGGASFVDGGGNVAVKGK